MANVRSRSRTWRTVLIVGLALLIVALLTAGFIVPLLAVGLLVLVLGGGALLYRMDGPPDR